MNICDVDTHELLHQEVTDSDDLQHLLLALKEVAALPFIAGRIAVVYYDKVTANTRAKIKRATGAKYVLQDPWHVCNRINSVLNNRVGGDLYDRHVRAVSNAIYKLNEKKTEEIKLKLWRRQLKSCLSLPGEGRKKTKFSDLTAEQICTHLMQPEDWTAGCGWMPVLSEDDAEAAEELRGWVLLPKFYDTFKASLMKDIRPQAEMAKMLDEVFFEFQFATHNGKALYPHVERVRKRFMNAIKRCQFMEDPAEYPVYRVIGLSLAADVLQRQPLPMCCRDMHCR